MTGARVSVKNVASLIRKLTNYQNWIRQKTQELLDRLGQLGALEARVYFETALYDGVNDVKVEVVPRGEGFTAIVATGAAVLFIEFGAGYLKGYGHKEPMGYGPGTYPGKGHWNDPNGWYYAHDKRSFGNKPAAAMYNARKALEQDIEKIAAEVFK